MGKSYIWRKHSGMVFESSLSQTSCQLSGEGDLSYDVIRSNNRRLDEFYASACFVLPDFMNEQGTYNLLSLSRLATAREHVFLCFSYRAQGSRFGFHMNAGNTSTELVGAATRTSDARLVRGRVLHVYVHLSRERLFGAVYDGESGCHLTASGSASGGEKRPWGACPTGRWRASIGRTQVADRRFHDLPPDFGLSDLLVGFGSHSNREVAPLKYLGALEHLRHPPVSATSAPSRSSAGPSGFQPSLSRKGEQPWLSC